MRSVHRGRDAGLRSEPVPARHAPEQPARQDARSRDQADCADQGASRHVVHGPSCISVLALIASGHQLPPLATRGRGRPAGAAGQSGSDLRVDPQSQGPDHAAPSFHPLVLDPAGQAVDRRPALRNRLGVRAPSLPARGRPQSQSGPFAVQGLGLDAPPVDQASRHGRARVHAALRHLAALRPVQPRPRRREPADHRRRRRARRRAAHDRGRQLRGPRECPSVLCALRV